MKFYPTNDGRFAVEDSEVSDALALALVIPHGQAIINELAHDGPYFHGLFTSRDNPKSRTSVRCPYCKAPVLRYEYTDIGLCMLICKEIAVFMRLPVAKLTKANWRRMVRHTARTWTEVTANQKGGLHGGLS